MTERYKQPEVPQVNPAVASLVAMIGVLGEVWKPIDKIDEDYMRILEEKAAPYADKIADSTPKSRKLVNQYIEAIRTNPRGKATFANVLSDLIANAEERRKKAKE